MAWGLSPPTRGNLVPRLWRKPLGRSIPAHAGEPSQNTATRMATPVYPRPRGGTLKSGKRRIRREGLSPPTRGNHCGFHRRAGEGRSIPAHAGEPAHGTVLEHTREVYPRPRGGTSRWTRRARISGGLSPPTRGNPCASPSAHHPRRSIPAHAGEPLGEDFGVGAATVYPRPRGGTDDVDFERGIVRGLSPPTRGNHYRSRRRQDELRSIPAHAGEPSPGRRAARAGWVYPRPRGGTQSRQPLGFAPLGLSPPTRGNPASLVPARPRPRSIPAHAGEPTTASDNGGAARVYPRPRGGTGSAGQSGVAAWGLSPPTRGNLARVGSGGHLPGSIPAHAGEPGSIPIAIRSATVYPRPRGGTARLSFASYRRKGLSPPTRGNLAHA